MTRRDLQAEAKKLGRPWEIAKAFERSAPIGPIVPASDTRPPRPRPRVTLAVNGDAAPGRRPRPDDLEGAGDDRLPVAASSRSPPGDVILTGTPAGVGAVVPGDVMEARIATLPPLVVTVV